MYVKMLRTQATPEKFYLAGQVYGLPQATADEWIERGIAAATAEVPSFVADLYARLDETAGKRALFLPFVGEFGHLVMSHLRVVHFAKAAEKIVCCRPGQEALFPSADGFVTDWTDPVADVERAGTMDGAAMLWPDILIRHPGHVLARGGSGLTREQQLVAIHPERRIPFAPRRRGLRADVVLGIRRRAFCPERNWPHWQHVADRLIAAGLTVAVVGDRATSHDVAGQVAHSGDYDTDAAIELLQGCRVYVGTDSGASHLASTVGVPMVIFRESASGSRDLTPRMAQVNPARTNLVNDGWARPNAVVTLALAELAAQGVGA